MKIWKRRFYIKNSRVALGAALILLGNLFLTATCFATPVTTIYEVSKPTFTDPVYAPINALLASVSTINGNLVYDTDDLSGTGLEHLFESLGTITHTANIDSLFNRGNTGIVGFLDGAPSDVGDWIHEIGNQRYIFNIRLIQSLSRDRPHASARCRLIDTTGFCPDHTGTEYVDITVIKLETTPTVPEPTTLALMGLGLAGIGYKRRQLKKA